MSGIWMILLGLFMGPTQFQEREKHADTDGMLSGRSAGCVHWKSDVKYKDRYLFHVVRIENRCDNDIRCDLKTDVNRKPQILVVRSQSTRIVEVLASTPESEFKVNVSCRKI